MTPASRIAAIATLALVSQLGCAGPREGAPAPVPSASSTRLPAKAPAGPLILARKAGLFEIDLDGAIRRRLSSTPASAPRFLPHRNALVFLGEHAAAGAGASLVEVRVLDLDSGAESVVAALDPMVVSGPGGEGRPLAVRDDGGLILDQGGKRVCVDALDRNVNMASCWIHFEIDLPSRSASRSTVVWEPVCGPAPAPIGKPSRCIEAKDEPSPASMASNASNAWPYHLELRDGGVGTDLVHGATRVGSLGDYLGAAASPSGRWVALRGHREEADYIHFLIVLLDRQTGELFPLGKGPWPDRVDPAVLEGPRAGLARAEDTVTESPLRWISSDALLLEGRIYLPEPRRIVDIDGELAR